ncbi:VOC family protein [Sphingobacterium pedocola]|uniref:Glyoxalase n=1 Tax=Sphingobacterium pedocola TaxID=2082722 RepID=A0ABR9T2J9_9SPHI|nr:glyoxalase [Sphingobacterium pedocola]MBE8719578.1 glyoxalase [Sphingobacterium pedocola]
MIEHRNHKVINAVFITFSGNCKKALTFYQSCFGGTLQFETFGEDLQGYTETPVVNGSLVSDKLIIHGSDLVHNEGRKIGNYISIFLHCENTSDRKELIKKLEFNPKTVFAKNFDDQKLIEVTDAFDVRWLLSV